MDIRYLNRWHLKGHINEGGEKSEPTQQKMNNCFYRDTKTSDKYKKYHNIDT